MHPSLLLCGSLLFLCCSIQVKCVRIRGKAFLPHKRPTKSDTDANDQVSPKIKEPTNLPKKTPSVPFPGLHDVDGPKLPTGIWNNPDKIKVRPVTGIHGTGIPPHPDNIPPTSFPFPNRVRGPESKITPPNDVISPPKSLTKATDWKNRYGGKIRDILMKSTDPVVFFKKMCRFAFSEIGPKNAKKTEVIKHMKRLMEEALDTYVETEDLATKPPETESQAPTPEDEHALDKIPDKVSDIFSGQGINVNANLENENEIFDQSLGKVLDMFSSKFKTESGIPKQTGKEPLIPKQRDKLLTEIKTFFRSVMVGNGDQYDDASSLCKKVKSFHQKILDLKDGKRGPICPSSPPFKAKPEDFILRDNLGKGTKGQLSSNQQAIASLQPISGSTNGAPNGVLMTLIISSLVAMTRILL